MAEFKRKHKETGRIGVFDKGTKDFLRWEDEAQKSEPQEMGIGTAGFLHGLQEATFGTSDEIIGAMNAVPEMFTAPRQEGEGLIEKYKRLYQQERDLERSHLEQATEEQPTASLVGGLAGGFALPGAWLAKGGLLGAKIAPKIADIAPFLGKTVPKMITGGAEAGALYGLGTSEKEDFSGNISDMISGAKGGAVIGGGLGGLGAGASFLAPYLQKILPSGENVISRAWKKGRTGTDITSSKFDDDMFKSISNETDELTGLLGEEQQKIQKTIEAGKKETFDILDKTRNKVNENLDESKDNLMGYLENQKQIQTTVNKDLQIKLQKDLEQKAIQLQQDIDGVRVGLGKEYDLIDKAAEKAQVQIDSTPVIDSIMTAFTESGKTDTALKAIAKKFEPETGKIDFKSFQSLKRKLREMFDDGDPIIRGVAKKAYGRASEAFEQTLRVNKLDELADQINQTNRRWSIYSSMDDFITGTRTQKPFNETFATPKTIQTIENLGLPGAESLSMKRQLETRLPEIMPKQASTRLDEMTKLSQDIEGAKRAKVEVPSLDEALATDKPFQKQQQILDELKGTKISGLEKGSPETQKIADIIAQTHGPESAKEFLDAITKMEVPAQQSFIKQFGSNPESIKKKLLSLSPAVGEKSASFSKQQEIEDLLKIYSEKFGAEKTGQLKTKLEELAKDIDLSRTASGATAGAESFTKPGLIKALIGGGITTGLTRMSGTGGLLVHDILNAPAGKLLAQAAETSDKFLKNILQQAGTRDKTGRQALLFTLMQHPDYREYIQSEEEP